ncbi:hypothetical protein [Streptacidiphilus albus]|uniref:hypothetical protein n=1 Tax=Streptacidiphilus albus TaxID=105425 RepID=UPI000A900AA6|nr:hypothetical protein [Streptacidiphilus albus]
MIDVKVGDVYGFSFPLLTNSSKKPVSVTGRLFRTLRGGLNRCGVAWTGSRWLAVART